MIEGQKQELQKVANELNVDFWGLMATVKLYFDNIQADYIDVALQNVQQVLDQPYQKIRRKAHAKNSGVMANQDLLPAVNNLVRTINQINCLQITVDDFGLGERLDNSLERTIFRIIQELVTNIIQYSGADKASVQFTQHEHNLNIIVEDNGSGFELLEKNRSYRGFELGTIASRIEHLGGTFTIDSILEKRNLYFN